jgi:glutathionylspermidine synthase
MQRMAITPRSGWQAIVESQGMLFHSSDDRPYWDEGCYYLFEAKEIDQIEAATYALDAMCLQAAEYVITNRLFERFDIPAPFARLIAESWDRDEHTVYGRFDLACDGVNPPKLLEYNADTPTALLEAAVIQWFWFKDATRDYSPGRFDQFNSLHERLIEAWAAVGGELGGRVVFASLDRDAALEDYMTVSYLRDTAIQAGLETSYLAIKDLGWHAGRRVFTDLAERAIPTLFKLYPWEWLIREPFGRHLLDAPTRWLEPPWKMVLSNKAILPVLADLFPKSPYLLRASFEEFDDLDSYVAKPILAREGANITVVEHGLAAQATPGPYGDVPCIFQEFHPLPEFDRRHPVVGSWMVNGHACGIGIREDEGLITGNTSRFVPHLFRHSPSSRPPGV